MSSMDTATQAEAASASAAAGDAAGPLSHPLFSDSIAAATHGDYRGAFSGIAALIDEDDDPAEEATAPSSEQTSPSRRGRRARSERPTSVPLEFAHSHPASASLAHMHGRAPSSGSTTPSITWTRPSAIRVAKQRAAELLQQQSARKARPVPYEKHAHTAAGAAAAAASVASSAAAALPTSPVGATSGQMAPMTSGGSSSGDYRPIRSHQRRSFRPTRSSQAAVTAAGGGGGGDDDSGGGGGSLDMGRARRSVSGDDRQLTRRDSSDIDSVAFTAAAAAAAQGDTHSSGEATMLLRMWKM